MQVEDHLAGAELPQPLQFQSRVEARRGQFLLAALVEQLQALRDLKHLETVAEVET
jgi:hypothetical protein